MNAPETKAIFLSYASQDAEAAKRLCEALRAAGVEVWFDQNELRGGDAWDQKIRRQIKECALFVPVISPNTNARPEGYFRLEWKLAVDRSHLLADDHPFLFPVVVGDVNDATARVPDKFREVQWTRVRLDESPVELAARVVRLLAGESATAGTASRHVESGPKAPPAKKSGFEKWWWLIFPIMGMSVPIIGMFKRPSRPEKPAVTAPAAVSEARQLAAKARALIEAIDSTADDFAAAEALINRALELDATDGEIWAVSSRINSSFLSRGFERGPARRETARTQAERAVKLAPASVDAWLALGRGIGMTDPARAEEALRRGLSLAPQDGRLLLALGSIYRQTNRFDEALVIYEQAAARPESRALARYDQYLIHFYSRRFAEADRCLRESISESKSSNMVAGLALLELTWRGDVAQARQVLAEAPPNLRGQTRVVLASVLVNLMAGLPDEALHAFDRLPADYVNDAWYTGPKALLVGLAHHQAGRQEAARIAWESGLAVVRRRLQEAPNDLELHLRLGELLAWTGQTEAALQQARIFNELQRGRATDWTYSPARILAALGRPDDALPLLEQLLTAPASTRWPLTPALLRLDPLWSKLRGDPRFQKLCEEPKATAAATLAKPDDKSVAVLAFANLSDDKANEYFSDGISEELLNVLAKVPGLKVSARTSAFYFKGKEVPVPEIARQLGVAYVVEGSVRRAGDKVRITAQLIKAADGFRVWNDTFTRDLKDIFAVQDEIAGLVAKNLSLQLGMPVRPVHQASAEAIALLTEGQHYWSLRTKDGFARAGELYRQAIQLDPAWARAHAALAKLQVIESSFRSGAGEDMTALFAEAERNALRAIELDPNSSDAYAALGKLATDRSQWAKSAEHLAKALELDPNNVAAHDWNADRQLLQGRLDLARAGYRRALELDPLSPFVLFDNTWALLHLRRFAEMKPLIVRAVALTPNGSTRLSVRQAHVFLRLGLRAEAEAALRPALAGIIAGEDGAQISEAVWCLRELGWREELEHVSTATLARPGGKFSKGVLLAALGRMEEAYPHLLLATPIMLQVLYFDPIFDAVRDTPEFRNVLRKLGGEREHATARATLAQMLQEGGAAR